ncbi:MAG: glycosyltransferase family 8 protein [Bacteroidota bacterium]
MPIPTLVYAADQAYADPLVYSAYSCLAHSTAPRIRLCILDHGIADRTPFRRLTDRFPNRVELHFFEVSPLLSRVQAAHARHETNVRLPPTTLARLFMAEVLPPSFSPVLYLDCDTLILADIQELLEAWPAVAPCGAVGEHLFHAQRDRWPNAAALPAPHTRLFNAGVLLTDLHWWREAQVAERTLGVLTGTGPRTLQDLDLRYLDQDALNLVLGTEVRPLPPRWNAQNGSIGRTLSLSLPELASHLLKRDLGIIHYVGRSKPWSAFGLRIFNPEMILTWMAYTAHLLRVHHDQPWRTASRLLLQQIQAFGPHLRRFLDARLLGRGRR